MQKALIHFVFCMLAAATAAAQSPAKVLKQAEKALGGKAMQAVRTLIQSGTITRVGDGAMGRYVSKTSLPNLLTVRYDIAGFETEIGYNGRSAWSRNSREGLRTLTGTASTAMQAAAVYRNSLWLNYKQQKAKVASGGVGTVNDKPANIVVITTPKGIVLRLWFDAATGLPVRDEVAGDITEYADYRSIGRVKRPFAIRLITAGETYEIKLDEVKTKAAIARTEFDFPVLSDAPLPDIHALLSDVQANEDRVEALLDSYSFTQKVIKRELGKDGVLRETESETFQMSFHKGRRISRLIEKNGRPLSPKDQADADRDVEKRIDAIEKDAAKNEARETRGDTARDERRISIAEVLRASKLTNPRRERFRGRDVVVFDFEPNPDFDMKNAKSLLKFFGKTAGVMWIDVEDKQVARLEASLADSFNVGGGVVAKLKKGASFVLDQERVGGEIWLPSEAEINLAVRVLLVKGINVNQVVKSYGYSKFQTEVKDAAVGQPQKP